MNVKYLTCRRILLVCSVVFVIVAIVLISGVIPSVKADNFPGATPEKAVSAFWVNVGLNLLLAVTILFIAVKSKERQWISKSGLIITGIIILLLGLALLDAASAYLKHGPSMQSASILLFICSASDLLAGIMLIITSIICPRKPESA